jgi:hypothetical protein
MEIVQTGNLLALGLYLRQSRQEQRGKDGDDGDNDQELNERKRPTTLSEG